jgi:hypothetical protein
MSVFNRIGKLGFDIHKFVDILNIKNYIKIVESLPSIDALNIKNYIKIVESLPSIDAMPIVVSTLFSSHKMLTPDIVLNSTSNILISSTSNIDNIIGTGMIISNAPTLVITESINIEVIPTTLQQSQKTDSVLHTTTITFTQ